MSKFVNLQSVLDIIKHYYPNNDMINEIRNLNIENPNLINAEWVKDDKGSFHHCSNCGAETYRQADNFGHDFDEYLSDYCPNCGADMNVHETVDEWVDTKDYLPDNDDEVLIWYEYFRYGDYNCVSETYGIARYIHRYNMWSGNDLNGTDVKVLKWQPLPKPPKRIK